MKKLLSIILVAAMLCGMLTFGTGAEASTSEIFDAIDYVLDDYLWLAEWCGGYFSEEGAPSADAVDQCFKWNVEMDYADYCVEMDEYGFGTFRIPAEIYENELVFTVFAETDAMVEKLHSADFYKTDKDEPYYEIMIGGGFGGPLPVPVTQSYTVRNDGLIEAYAYLAEYIDYDQEIGYVPAEGEVEGEDYIIIGVDTWEYDDETGISTQGFKYVSAKISAVIRSVIELDVDGWTAVYHSYEQIDRADMPATEDMITHEDSKDIAFVGGAFMEMDRDTFGEGTAVYGEMYFDNEDTEDDVFDTTAELLKDYGELGGVYEFNAKKNGESVQPNKPVSVSFMLPYDFSPDSTVYYIAEDGAVTALETAIDPDSYDPTLLYATAELEHFSRYAVAGVRYGDSNEDGNVNLSDVSAMLKSVAKWEVEVSEVAVDANRDGKVTLADITIVMKYIAGWEVMFGPAV